ncbi:hypothetical protein HDU98_010962 [Podochytrium sp. JEL0797]|nr:hypothetical protein HDU98_010962 [Podochytrium sp. JEL0797]
MRISTILSAFFMLTVSVQALPVPGALDGALAALEAELQADLANVGANKRDLAAALAKVKAEVAAAEAKVKAAVAKA